MAIVCAARSIAVVLGVAALILTAPVAVLAADSPAWAACKAIGPPGASDRQIAGCTAAVAAPNQPPAMLAFAYYLRGGAYRRKGDDPAAIADFGRAVGLVPSFAEAYQDRGLALAAHGDFGRAISDLSEAIRLKPALVAAYDDRAEVYDRLTAYDTAIQDETRALGLQPNDVKALTDRCWDRTISGGSLSDALADCDAALRLQPGLVAALDSRGLVHLRLNDYGAAIDDYTAALKANPSPNAARASSLYGRGVALSAMGGPAVSQADIAAAVAIDPTVAQPYAALGLQP